MATGTRSSKRKRKPEAEASEIEESPSNPTSPTKRGKKKKPTRQKNREQEDEVQEIPPEAGEDSGSKSDADKQKDDRPSGYPFTTEEVEWKFVRLGQLKQAKKKIIPGGYEGLCGEVNDLLKGLKHQEADKVRYSAMGEFTRLDNNATRNGNMLHYVLCHQVIPDPVIDDTALYFKIGRRVVRFSREEYALVSGLKFGPANFNPYTVHDIPPNSTFSRLFGENPDTTLSKLRTTANAKKFMVDGKSVKATPDDWVKICKLLLCLGFVFGVDGCKKKIPTWMWVLLENEEEWENFPWGSISFQVLLDTIKGITTKTKQEGTLNINFKGNTVAFSAWIFEAIPAFGEAIGLKKDEHQIPRFMEYSYTTSRVWPTDKQIKKRVLRTLKPRSDEKVSTFWKSLELDPTPHPFAFQYDPTDSMKRKGKAKEEDDEDNIALTEASGPQVATSSSVLIDVAAVTKIQAAMKAMLEDYHNNTLKAMLAEYHKNLLEDVAEKVTNLLLERATTDNAYNCGSDVRDTLETLDPMADTQNTVPSTPLEKSQVYDKALISTPATTKVVAVEENTTIPTGALESPGNSLFSLGMNFNASQVEELVPVSGKSTVQAATAAAETSTAAASTEIPAASAAAIAQAATTKAPKATPPAATGGTTAAPAEAQTATPTANPEDGGQV